MSRAAIFGCLSTAISPQEKAFFKEADPWGFILFARNIDTPEQIRTLCSELRDTVGWQAPILIDQEGGRVARLRPPLGRDWLAPLDQMAQVPAEFAREAMVLRYRLIAHELRDLGIDVNCAPMLDVARDETHEIILNRCYGRDPEVVAEMGRAVSEGLLAGGVLPIIKHIPGHGRGKLDSHLDCPRLRASRAELADDFLPFSRLSDLPMAMTAHIIYEAIDPQAPATLSAEVIETIRNDIGFDGLLMTDDLSMQALSGDFTTRTRKALDAGCDMILHCNGDRAEMEAILAALGPLEAKASARSEAAINARQEPAPFDVKEAEARLSELLSRAER